MVQSILMTGTILASSIGCALAALALGSAIKSAWKRTSAEHLTGLESVGAYACRFPGYDSAVRGYDSPELYRQDNAARSRQAGDYQKLH